MKLASFCTVLVLALSISSCREEDPSTVVGSWEVISHRIEQIKNDEVISDLTYRETGIYEFKGDGTGSVKLDVLVPGIPPDQDILWETDETGRVRINYQNGEPVRVFNPSYRGDFLFLAGTYVTGSLTSGLTFTNTEIFFRRR